MIQNIIKLLLGSCDRSQIHIRLVSNLKTEISNTIDRVNHSDFKSNILIRIEIRVDGMVSKNTASTIITWRMEIGNCSILLCLYPKEKYWGW